MAPSLTSPVETKQDTAVLTIHPNHPLIKGPEIIIWLQSLPSDPVDLTGAFEAPTPTIAQYQDFFHHCETRAQTLLQHLDAFEYKYRSIGLTYHQLPWAVRYSGRPAAAHISQRLTQLFDTDTPRRRQTYFKDWYEILDRAVGVLIRIKLLEKSTDLKLLGEYYALADSRLQGAENFVDGIEIQLVVLDSLVVRVRDKAIAEDSMRGIVDLKWKYTKEGTSFRRWVYTFDEVHGLINSGSDSVEVRTWTEQLIQGWLTDGVTKGVEWSHVEAQNSHT